jgi:hypothetical protein
MATRKKQEAVEVDGLAEGNVDGLALVDIPSIGAKCGEWVSLPAEQASALESSGEFDPKAQKPE